MNRIFTLALILIFTLSTGAQKSGNKENDRFAEEFTNAAEKGDLHKLESILARGINVNISRSDWKGWTALMSACTFGQTKAVKFLISKGANVNERMEDGDTPLIQAAQSDNNKEIVEALLNAGADIEGKSNKGLTALMRFAWMGQIEPVKLLLATGAKTQLRDNHGWTAFRYAVYSAEGEITKLLLKHETDLNQRDEKGETPIMWFSPSEKAEVLRVLIDAGADVNAQSKNGTTALMTAARCFFQNDVEEILTARADVKITDKKGWNALMYAASSIYERDQFGLHGNGHIRWLEATKILARLISAGTNVNSQNEDGETALILAMKAGNAHFALYLLTYGADPRLKTRLDMEAKDYLDKIPKYQREELRKSLARSND